jgi:hypothetical protein
MRIQDGDATRDSRAVEATLPTSTTRLSLEIGERGDPDFVDPDPFEVSGVVGEAQEIAIGGIPPGLNKRVAFFARNALGKVIASGEVFLDFLPGEITSNVLDLSSPADQSAGTDGGGGAPRFPGRDRQLSPVWRRGSTLSPVCRCARGICPPFAARPAQP